MTRFIISALIALLVSGPAWALKDQTYGKGIEKCSTYLGAYSSLSMTGTKNYTASLETHKFFGFVDGFRSAHPTKRTLMGTASYRW